MRSELQVFRRLLQVARPYRQHLIGVWALTLLGTPIALLAPLPLRIAVDSVVGTRPLPRFLAAALPAFAQDTAGARLWTAAGPVVAIAIVAGVHVLCGWALNAYTSERLALTMRMALFRHAQRLSLAYHDSKGSSDSVYRIQYDAASLPAVAINAVTSFVNPVVMVVAMVAATAFIDWPLALVALLVCPMLYLAAGTFRGRLITRWKEVKRLESSAMAVVQEMLGAVRVVKAFQLEEREQKRFLQLSNDRIREYLAVAGLRGRLDFVVGVTIAVGTATVLFVGVRHVQSGALTLGALLVVMAYLAQIYDPLKTISASFADLQSGFTSATRAFSYLDELPEAVETPHAKPLRRATGAIAFRHVSFSYDKVRQVLNDISFDIKPGSRVGIQGRTGAGKSTMVNLLMRFYDPDSGQILLDGVDTRDYRLSDLRDQFALVLQDPVLFSTTIWNNIACGKPFATKAEILTAARLANAHEFIERLPSSYDTEVGERGMSLSGGERQRVSLARAFLKDAPILILDEPTSAIDVGTESVIVDAIERLMQGRTTFVIAHRLSTLDGCDVRLEMDSGRVESLVVTA